MVAENISRCGRVRRWSSREKSREHEEESGGVVRRLGERQQCWSAASSSASCVVQEEEERRKRKEKKRKRKKRRGMLAQLVGLLKANGMATQRKEKGRAGWATSAAQIEEKANGLRWKIKRVVYIYIYIFLLSYSFARFLKRK
jgi:hypothetical protein